MSYKKKNRYTRSITFFILTGIGLVFLILAAVNLFQNNLIVFNPSEESTIDIPYSGEYYILVDTDSVRYVTEVEEIGVTNNVAIYNEDTDTIYEASLLLKAETDTGATLIDDIEFDKQIRHKGYLSFGKVTLKKDTYTYNGVIQTNDEEFGDYALLSMNYVNKIGMFSLSAMTTLLFALLGFKYYREVKKVPMSKYLRKHMVKK